MSFILASVEDRSGIVIEDAFQKKLNFFLLCPVSLPLNTLFRTKHTNYYAQLTSRENKFRAKKEIIVRLILSFLLSILLPLLTSFKHSVGRLKMPNALFH